MPSSTYYPLFVSLEQCICLVVGGGSVAERKIRTILQHRGTVRIVAGTLTSWLQTQCAERTIQLLGSAYTRDYLKDIDLVFAATGDFALNRKIAEDAGRCRLWCNMATEPELGSFIVPSFLRRGPLTIAISTAGTSPAVAVQIRRKLEGEFGTEWTVLLQLMSLLRAAIQARGLDSLQNQDTYRKIAELPLLDWIRARDEVSVVAGIAGICHPWLSRTELTLIWSEAWKQSS